MFDALGDLFACEIASQSGSQFETDVQLHVPQLMLWCDAIIPTGRFVALRLGLGVGGSFAIGRFDDGGLVEHRRKSYLTVAGRFGVEFRYPPRLGERLAFGLFGAMNGLLLFNYGFSAHFAVIIYGLP